MFQVMFEWVLEPPFLFLHVSPGGGLVSVFGARSFL